MLLQTTSFLLTKPSPAVSTLLKDGALILTHLDGSKAWESNSYYFTNVDRAELLNSGWGERFKIALGTAKGLAYLHHECLEWVIHCDVKPENILLDHDFEPKISDFGLAKLSQRGDNGSSKLSKIRGTKGYMAPEWTTNLPLTAKVDVYSYGVVMLELVRGVRLSSGLADDHHGKEEMPELTSFARIAKRQIMLDGDDSSLEDLVDPRLEGRFSCKQAATIIKIGLSYIEDDRNKRPTMEAVVHALAECEAETSLHTANHQ